MPLAIFKKYSTRLKLINPRARRFATNFFMIDKLVKEKVAFEQCIIDPDWVAFVRALRDNSKGKPLTKARRMCTTIRFDDF